VDAEDALFRHPSLALGGDEFPDSVLSDKLQVFDLAHAISRAVTLVEVPQPVAGKLRAMAAEFAGAFSADAEAAVNPRFGLVLLGFVAAVARVILTQVRFTDAAVHPARGDEILDYFPLHLDRPLLAVEFRPHNVIVLHRQDVPLKSPGSWSDLSN